MVRVPEIKEMDDLGRGSLVIDGDGLREGWWFIEQVVTQFPLGSIIPCQSVNLFTENMSNFYGVIT
jgi:hypothetical protein